MQFQKISILLTTPTEEIEISWGWVGGGGGASKTKIFKVRKEAYLEFPEGANVLEKKPSAWEVWIIIFCNSTLSYDQLLHW